ncbi:MAG TPA: nucleotidyltransferase domain-containing protein [Oligoflexia bacterium]|nr:nucleotidyltransferase domain-containing protein [Oligoflexia bacterium]HMP49440.1 nucleotidyltransferase domain-containing protein [Oligoflexia bacterium]
MAKNKDSIFLRVNSELANNLKLLAKKHELSLNEYCSEILESRANARLRFDSETSPADSFQPGIFDQLVSAAKSEYQGHLKSVLLFGSFARGEETIESDIDILIILDKKLAVTRKLYESLDSKTFTSIPSNVSIHLTHLPSNFISLSGLWCEVALEGIMLYDSDFKVSRFLITLREKILLGHYKPSYSHGHRYWIYQKEAA